MDSIFSWNLMNQANDYGNKNLVLTDVDMPLPPQTALAALEANGAMVAKVGIEALVEA